MDQKPEPKFLHFRFRDASGQIVPFGGRTIAYVEVPEGIRYSVALCHVNDNFNKHLGRVKSGGRLNSKTQSKVYEGNEQAFLGAIESDIEVLNVREKQAAMAAGYSPADAFQYVRKFNGRRKGRAALTEADALADVAGTARPDHPGLDTNA